MIGTRCSVSNYLPHLVNSHSFGTPFIVSFSIGERPSLANFDTDTDLRGVSSEFGSARYAIIKPGI